MQPPTAPTWGCIFTWGTKHPHGELELRGKKKNKWRMMLLTSWRKIMMCIRRARLLFVLFSFFIFGCIIIENANSLFNPIYLAAKYNIRQSGSFSKK